MVTMMLRLAGSTGPYCSASMVSSTQITFQKIWTHCLSVSDPGSSDGSNTATPVCSSCAFSLNSRPFRRRYCEVIAQSSPHSHLTTSPSTCLAVSTTSRPCSRAAAAAPDPCEARRRRVDCLGAEVSSSPLVSAAASASSPLAGSRVGCSLEPRLRNAWLNAATPEASSLTDADAAETGGISEERVEPSRALSSAAAPQHRLVRPVDPFAERRARVEASRLEALLSGLARGEDVLERPGESARSVRASDKAGEPPSSAGCGSGSALLWTSPAACEGAAFRCACAARARAAWAASWRRAASALLRMAAAMANAVTVAAGSSSTGGATGRAALTLVTASSSLARQLDSAPFEAALVRGLAEGSRPASSARSDEIRPTRLVPAAPTPVSTPAGDAASKDLALALAAESLLAARDASAALRRRRRSRFSSACASQRWSSARSTHSPLPERPRRSPEELDCCIVEAASLDRSSRGTRLADGSAGGGEGGGDTPAVAAMSRAGSDGAFGNVGGGRMAGSDRDSEKATRLMAAIPPAGSSSGGAGGWR
mmetsp:Transcript_23878/g.79335  ORF Transcript_23878/g.79335 Transcript_23878/m.79335 type:complete len:541 (+) Transcript_23878:842-2464(+)